MRGLAASRFDWEQALRDISHAVPGDVKLQTLNGDMGLPGATGAAGDPLRSSDRGARHHDDRLRAEP